MELQNFKIVLDKSLITAYNSGSRNTLVSHVSRREVLPASVPLHLPLLHTTRGKFRYCYILEGLKTKHTFNVIHVEFLCA